MVNYLLFLLSTNENLKNTPTSSLQIPYKKSSQKEFKYYLRKLIIPDIKLALKSGKKR